MNSKSQNCQARNKAGFIIDYYDFDETDEFQSMIADWGMLGRGIFDALKCLLCHRRSGKGTEEDIRHICIDAHKSRKSILSFLENYGLFDVKYRTRDGKTVVESFRCKFIRKKTVVETTVSAQNLVDYSSENISADTSGKVSGNEKSGDFPHYKSARLDRDKENRLKKSFVVVDTPTKDIAAAAEIPTTKTEHFSDEGLKKILSQLAADTQYIANIAAVDGIDIDRNAAHLDFALRLWADSSKANGVICTEKPLTLGEAKAKFLKWTGTRVYRNWEEKKWKENALKTHSCEAQLVEMPEYARKYVEGYGRL